MGQTMHNHDLRWGVIAVAAFLFCLLPSGAADAQMLCSKPLQPLCSTEIQDFEDPAEKERCVTDTDSYLEELRDYQTCLQNAVEKAQQALSKAESFKGCLDSGRNDCGLEEDDGL